MKKKLSVEECFERYHKKPFRILLALYQGKYLRLASSTIMFIIKHIPAWIMPIVIANVIDLATTPKKDSFRWMIFNGVIMIILVGQNILSNYYHTKFHSSSIREVETDLRAALIIKLQELSIPYQKELQSGRLQSKIMRDVESIQTLSSQLFVSSLNIIVNLVAALGITLYTSPIVFFFFLVTVPVAAVVIVSFREKIKVKNSAFRREMEETSARVVEMIELVPVARAHSIEDQEINRLNQRFEKIADKGFHLDMIQSVFGSVSWACFQVFQIICLIFTGYLALNGKIKPGDIVMYQTYFTTVVNSVSSMITLIPTISKGLESVTSIGEVLTAGEVEDYQGKNKLKQVKGDFQFEQVWYQYPSASQPTVRGLNLDVQSGETVAFVGSSGSGKSTILNLLIGFIQPTKGKIRLDGQDMKKIDLRTFREHLAVVPQNTILFSGTIRDNITYGLKNVSESELEACLKAANLWEMVQQLPEGWETQIGEHGDKLSGGQRQRISIARALIRNPEVIILDEATSALDSDSEQKIQQAIDRLAQNRTVFIVAHRLSTIRHADKIAVIEKGVCTEFGSYTELMEKKGRFYQLQQLQDG